MEVKRDEKAAQRQTEVRLATWLCEALEDTIHRFRAVIEFEKEDLASDEIYLAQEREKQHDPILGKYANPQMYEDFVMHSKESIAKANAAIDLLLPLLKSAQELKAKVSEFWEKR